ncbi:MAG TPA: MFS transporter [Pyrinomonadaceae bacterium]|nr:MFS transporter [Pyrinomonadaceae bacterium]
MSEKVNVLPTSLWRNRDYKVVLIGQGISNLGDGISATVLPLLVLVLTGSGVQMGIVGALERLPNLFFGLPAGVLADRWDRRRTMLYCDLGRALLTALVPLSLVLGIPTMPVVLCVAAPIGMLGVLFRAVYTAAIPKLVEREQIGPANAYFEALESMAWVIGPGLAGVLAAWIGPGLTLALDAVSFLASAFAISLVRRPLQSAAARSERMRILHEIWEGVIFIFRHTMLRTTIAFWALGRAIAAPLIPVITFFITIDRGLAPDRVGYAISAYAAGSVLGTLLAARASRGRAGLIMLGASAVTGAGLFILALSSSLPLILLGSFVFGAAEGLMLVAYLTLRATTTPNEILGRVGSAADTLVLGLSPLGMMAGGFLLDSTSGRYTLISMGLAILLISLIFTCSRHLRRADIQ